MPLSDQEATYASWKGETPATRTNSRRVTPLEFVSSYCEHYGPIRNLHTAALVGKNGSIDWCRIPRFDAPSVFGALLDAEKRGCFRIA
jgi:GH15 family glucan-1,4-alpha-glucosidase